ncbi:hypothetical protein LY76DRAFT_621045 [Colletotrichum caudatum]|nr:hypothetical protein LY76DRAFT_621045 [Colletotrichum caudatum]
MWQSHCPRSYSRQRNRQNRVPKQPDPRSPRNPPGIAPFDVAALVVFAGLVILCLYGLSIGTHVGWGSTRHVSDNPEKHLSGPVGSNGPTMTLTRARVCRVIRRLQALRQQTLPGTTPVTSAVYPKLFEYLGLAPDTAPNQAAVSKAWTARLIALDVDANDRTYEKTPYRSRTAAAARQLIIEGANASGVLKEGGLIHTVASILPIIRPPKSRIMIFSYSNSTGFKVVCPGN